MGDDLGAHEAMRVQIACLSIVFRASRIQTISGSAPNVFCHSPYQRSKSGMIALFFWRINVTDRMV